MADQPQQSRVYSASLSRRVAAPAPLVWALIADTNRWDRASGLAAARYEYRLRDPADPASRTRVATTRQYGVEIVWVEPPYQWVEGRSVRGQRDFLGGPVRKGGFTVELTPKGDDATEVAATAWVDAPGVLGGAAGLVMRAQFKAALSRYVDAIERMLTQRGGAIARRWDKEPPAALAQLALVNAATDEVVSGSVTPTNEADFAHRAARFAEAPVPAALRDRLLEFLRTRPDEELTQIRPFELARAWEADRREVLRAFLHAARAGLVDLQWQVNCPTCRVASEVDASLEKVGRTAHCDACNISFDLDFAAHVEAVFKVSDAVRKVEPALYCASSPWWRPHVFAQVALAPGESRTVDATLPAGPLLARTLAGRRRATLEVDAAAPPAELHVTVTGDSLELAPRGGSAPAGADTRIVLANACSEPAVLLVERAGWNADVVLGSVIASLPDFVDLFATEAPAAGVELSVSSLTLLFSDLTGSTAMYERLGDARAFAVVQEHFRLLGAAVQRHGGAIIKTMGDAIMASFTSPADALAAALEMVESAARAHGALGLEVKLGLHEGPCLAVRANDRLDYFGTTVNVAARLQAQAGGCEVVVMSELLEAHAGVAALVRERGLAVRPFTARLKGIREEQRLAALTLPGASASTAAGASAGAPNQGAVADAE